jgi:hypothetical protein
MSVMVDRPTIPCNVCGAAVTELRRGRCWGCYTRWADSRPVGRGASCTVCLEKRRLQLKLVEVKGRSIPFCHGCAALMLRLPDVPETIEELRQVLNRERRQEDRRHGKIDQRIFPRERRVGERRGPARDAYADTDPSIRLADYDDVIIELPETELEEIEQTMVRSKPALPGAASELKPNP